MNGEFKINDIVRFDGNTKSEAAKICHQLGITCTVVGQRYGCIALAVPGVPYLIYAMPSELEFVADATRFPADPGEE